jgi:hypothetical protein
VLRPTRERERERKRIDGTPVKIGQQGRLGPDLDRRQSR